MANFRQSSPTRRFGRLLPASLLVMTTLLVPTGAISLLDPNSLPSCAMNCATLNAASDGCVPPAAPVTNKQIYDSCFCQSALLTQLYNSDATQVCPECASDQSALDQISSWYNGFCSDSGAPTPPTTSSSTSTTTAAPTATGDSTTGTVSASSSSNDSSGSWISHHWQWIIFLAIVIIAIILLTLLLLWLKKRHARRRDARLSTVAGPGAHQSPNDTRSFATGPGMTQMSGANGSENSVIPVPPPARRNSTLRHSTFTGSKDSLPASGSAGRTRSISRPGSGFQQPPPVWGPHQNQHHTRGYAYDNPEVEIPPTPVSRQSGSWNARNSWGPNSAPHHGEGNEAKLQPREALQEEEEEEERPHTANGPVSNLAQGVRRKLSKRRQ